MSQLPSNPQDKQEWKTRTYVTGGVLGTFFGIAAAYLFARAAEENDNQRPPQVPTTQLIGIILAVLGLARQIAEMGKDKKK